MTPDSLDLGTVDRDRQAATALAIQNTGAGALFFTLDPQVSWLWSGTGEVPAGGTLRVVVTADSTDLAQGVHTGDIQVRSNDPDDDPVVVRARLTVLAPDIGVAPASFDLGTLDRDQCGTRHLTVDNSGDGTLVFDVSSDGLDLQVGTGEHRLPPATGSSVVQLSICTTGVDPGRHTLDIAAESNDPDEPVVLVPVYVTVPTPRALVSPGSLSTTLDRSDSTGLDISIVNSGNGTLTYRVESSVPWVFLLDEHIEGGLSSGCTGDVPIRFLTLGRDPGAYTGDPVVRTNDQLRREIHVPLNLTVLAPEMQVSPS